jgi:ZIP family zinc transporter
MHPIVLWLGLATCLSTFAGGIVILRKQASIHFFFAFAAGSLITVAFLDLMPEALELGAARQLPARALFGVLLAAFFLYSLIDRYFLTHHLHEDDTHGHPLGLFGAGSLVLHSLFDGVAIGIAFQAGPKVGAVVAAAVIAHDFSDGLNTVVLMLQHGQPRARTWGFLAADALAPLLGIAVATALALPAGLLAALLAFFAGEFLYLGASSLLLETQSHGTLKVMAAMLAGAAFVALVTLVV